VDRFLQSLERIPRAAVVGGSAFLVAVIALFDWVTGEDVSVSFFYTIPILLVTWLYGRTPGLALNGLCATIRLLLVIRWQGPDLLRKPELYWNMFVEGAFFITLTLIAAALRNLHDRQSLLARTDPLTGVANRRAFYERAELELSRSRRLMEAVTVAYIDLDDFKRVNDELGHDAGDDLLAAVAATFVRRVRSTDLVARLGGDEFALLLSATGAEAARSLLTELHATLAAELARQPLPVGLSVGVVTFLRPPASADEMLRRVDELMYMVKKDGKAGILFDVVPALPEGDLLPFIVPERPRA